MWRITKRRFWITVVIATVSLPTARCVHGEVRSVLNRRIIESARAKYAEALKPGTSRQEVESYLKAHGTAYLTRWPGADVNQEAYAILVKVAEEDTPWFCNGWFDYVTFEFAPTQPRKEMFLFGRPDESDVLVEVLQTSGGLDCL